MINGKTLIGWRSIGRYGRGWMRVWGKDVKRRP
jgi:hypothetical protein